MNLWTSDPKRLDETGRHRPLPRLTSEGGEASFEDLVASVSKDIRSRVILDEWLRTGIAINRCRGAGLPEHGTVVQGRVILTKKRITSVQNLHDHLCAASHNLQGQLPQMLENSVRCNKLTPESIAELDALAKRLGMQALDAVNKRAAELEARDADKPDAQQKMNFGIYFFSAEMQAKKP